MAFFVFGCVSFRFCHNFQGEKLANTILFVCPCFLLIRTVILCLFYGNVHSHSCEMNFISSCDSCSVLLCAVAEKEQWKAGKQYGLSCFIHIKIDKWVDSHQKINYNCLLSYLRSSEGKKQGDGWATKPHDDEGIMCG